MERKFFREKIWKIFVYLSLERNFFLWVRKIKSRSRMSNSLREKIDKKKQFLFPLQRESRSYSRIINHRTRVLDYLIEFFFSILSSNLWNGRINNNNLLVWKQSLSSCRLSNECSQKQWFSFQNCFQTKIILFEFEANFQEQIRSEFDSVKTLIWLLCDQHRIDSEINMVFVRNFLDRMLVVSRWRILCSVFLDGGNFFFSHFHRYSIRFR